MLFRDEYTRGKIIKKKSLIITKARRVVSPRRKGWGVSGNGMSWGFWEASTVIITHVFAFLLFTDP